MDFINLDFINFYKPPAQGSSSVDNKRNRSLDARAPFGNEQHLISEQCHGWADISKGIDIDEVTDSIGFGGDGDLASQHASIGDRDEGIRIQDISALAGNQQSHGKANDLPPVDELLSPTKQNRVTIIIDPNIECSLE